MKVKKDYAIVCSNEEFVRIKTKKGLKQGQKIFFTNDDLCDVKKERGTIMKGYKKYLAVAVSLVILLTAVYFIKDDSFASTVVVEINPSVQLSLDSDEIVKEVEPLNEDAKTFDIESIVGMKVEDAVENITSQAIDNGFLNIEDLEDDFILISALSKDDKDDIEKAIEEKREISDILKAANIAILWAEEKDVEDAKSQGKAIGLTALREKYGLEEDETLSDYFSNIENREEVQKNNKVIKEDIGHKVERVNSNLEKMDANEELKKELMSEFLNAKDELTNAIKTMKEAKKAYQDALDSDDDEALKKAEDLIKEAEEQKNRIEAIKDEVENTKNVMLAQYEEEKREEELKKIQEKVRNIKENTGKPENIGKPNDDDRGNNDEDENNNDEDENIQTDEIVGHEKAIENAFSLTDGGIVVEFKLDEDNDRYMYEIMIIKDYMEYEVEIDAHTGEVLNSETDDYDENIQTDKIVGHEKAMEIALDLTDGGIVVEFKLDEDDDRYIYEIMIKNDYMEYEIEINAHTGEVLNSETDNNNDNDNDYDNDYDDEDQNNDNDNNNNNDDDEDQNNDNDNNDNDNNND